MKRYKKKELLEVISSLEKINNEFVHNFNPITSITSDELATCQELAIVVGNAVETAGEHGEIIVKILEDYCEYIYQLSLFLADVDKRRKLAKKIQKQLIMLKDKIKYDLPREKKEIIFLPYKASMWDSFESVWKVASKDENCNTYVIPIPYFDKGTDGSFVQMHYEGDKYPKEVPITSWKEYSISERKPDIIYIHNPYDQYNFVTSVHPDYYASELKKYTDMLVYISYFVAVNDKIGGHFCRTPGVFYADKVIVQSKAVRNIYVKELHEYEKEYNCKGLLGDIEEKILALGHPKYDKAMSVKKTDYDISEEWNNLIARRDGRKRKIILYNTTIDGMLKHNERMLMKIKNVLEYFYKERDAVLLWRPHPLLQSTLESMRPMLAKQYQEIVENYKREQFGIFDDSADMYRAMAVSDAYFGDMSSVVELYKQTGKPVLIESVFYGGEKRLVFEAFVQVDEYTAYASCATFNGLFKIEMETGNCSYIGMFPEEIDNIRLHVKAIYTGGKVYFVPTSAEYISIYNIEKEKFESIPIRKPVKKAGFYNPDYKFADAILHGNGLFLIGATYPAVLRLSLETGKVDYYTNWVPDGGFSFSKGAVENGSFFYIPSTRSNAVLEFDMDTCEGKLHHLGSNNHGSLSMLKVKDDYWLIPKEQGSITKWNPVSNTVTEYNDYPDGFEGNGFLFTKAYLHEESIIMIPAYANMSVRVSQETGKITQNKFEILEAGYEIDFLFDTDHYCYLLKDRRRKKSKNPQAWNIFEYFRWNKRNNSIEKFNFRFLQGKEKFADDHKDYLEQIRLGRTERKEDIFYDMSDFLQEISIEHEKECIPLTKKFQGKEQTTIGRKIHTEIMKVVW